MKGCFILQRRFAYLGHAIARGLNEQYGVTDFCGYVYQRSSYDFLRTQKDITYSTLLLDEDVHKKYEDEVIDKEYLAYLEKTYGLPNLWPYLAVDRVLMSNQLVREYPYNQPPFSHETMLRILQAHARSIETMLIKEKPDFVVGSVMGGVGSLLLWHMAKKMGIKTYAILIGCTGPRYIISNDYNSFTDAEKKYYEYENTPIEELKEARAYLEDFRKKPQSYSAATEIFLKTSNRSYQFKFLRPHNLIQSVSWFFTIVSQYLKERKYQDYTHENNPLYYLVDRIKRKARNIIGINDLLDTFDPEEDYAFFPLHVEPEIALLLQAPWNTNQIRVISDIARSLPVHFKLYVKEHPVMAGYRPRSFYKEIKKIPNVKLINPGISSFTVITHAKLITTITGTVGWEATLLKKPVIMFGNQFYKFLDIVKKCTTPKDLPYLVKEQLENFNYDEAAVTRLVQAIIDDAVVIDIPRLWENEGDQEKKKIGLEPITTVLAKKLGLTKST